MTTYAILVRARALLARGWCQGARARDADGKPVSHKSPRAAAWCATGACDAAGDGDGGAVDDALNILAYYVGGTTCSIVTWNDGRHRTQAQILVAFDEAISGERP